jgi:hypothetical protein
MMLETETYLYTPDEILSQYAEKKYCHWERDISTLFNHITLRITDSYTTMLDADVNVLVSECGWEDGTGLFSVQIQVSIL